MFRKLSFFAGFYAVALVFSACGGGGGGGAGQGDALTSTTRTNGTGIRVIHAGLDVEPVDLKVGEAYLGRASYLEPNYFNQSAAGSLSLALERANSPGVVIYSNPVLLGEQTEYTLLLSGQVSRGSFGVSIFEEPVARPEAGQNRVQLINALEGSSPLTMSVAGQTLGPVGFRLNSSGVLVPSGPQTVVITNARGQAVANFAPILADRGEATFVVAGSTSQGVIITRVYEDLD